MRVPLTWLREYCHPGLGAVEIAERLDLTGTELERIEQVGVPSADGFVVGRVLSAEQHPDADRLKVCRVDVGAGEPSTIVCGAPNVAAGQTVPVALPGATMPGGTKLGKARLRGVESHGMILAEDELGIGDQHSGIVVLEDGLAPGAALADIVPIADEVLELEITPNRPDCLSVYGIAREVHAATGVPLAGDPTDADTEGSGSDDVSGHATVEIVDPDVCLRFTARVFEGVTIRPSPLWLKQRLIAAGQRPINNVVDITNYVMLLSGQPMHAFDLDEVRGSRIVVRRARSGETMTTLDGVERTFDASMALVCDVEGPSGIAGIMGGQVSEVSETTTRVLMEAATWVGPNVLKTSKALGLRSEASTRFEKQLHPEQALAAQRLAARLMVELAGARLVPGTIDAYPAPVEPRVVTLGFDRLERMLGVRIDDGEVERILASLGFDCERDSGSGGTGGAALAVTVPPWRDADVQREADLVEEVARVYGLDKLPTTLPARERAVGRLTHAQRLRRRLEDALRDRGMDEVVAWSFTSPETLAKLRVGDGEVLELANPLSEDHSVMRPLLLPGLLDAARRNAAHGAAGVALFESAHVYAAGGGLEAPEGSPKGATPAVERHHLAGLITESSPGTWRSGAGAADVYAAKGFVEALLKVAGLSLVVEPAKDVPFLHPGRAGSAFVAAGPVDGEISGAQKGCAPEDFPAPPAEAASGANGSGMVPIGWIGELHPLVAREWDLEGGAAFELDADLLAELTEGRLATYQDVTSFPAVLQDIAVVAAVDVSAAEVEAAVRQGGGELLASVRVFDVYEGEQVGEGKRSLALRLEFRAADRTLTEDEVVERRTAIEAALGEIGGRIRG
ncbi:MAG TPA: phenylalanine--tRNA ligase subunit beta [Thermoleophilaceae bacterium]|nr:phenylalanine--tRNA ligase subunit beta [Thermoleophilaceae bacterium]